MNLHELPIGDNAPHEVNAIIEIPQGTSNKVEYDPDWGAFVLDRTLFSSLYYPCNYGFVPSTEFEDGDPLDILVLCSQPVQVGVVVKARPIGVLRMRDDKGQDDKIISVFSHDPRFAEYQGLGDLSEHSRKEIVHFFSVYKDLEGKAVTVEGWHPVSAAHTIITQYAVPRPGR